MSNLAPSLLVPHAPQVNLIPPEVASRKAAGRKRGAILAAFVLFLLILGAVTYLADQKKQSAEAALKVEIDRGIALQAEVAKYAEVPFIKNQTKNAESAALYAGAIDIRWIDFIRLVAEGIPENITFESWTLGVDPSQAAGSPSVDPFITADIGVLAFSGSSVTYPDIAALERSVDAVEGFHYTSITDVTRNDVDKVVSYTFTGTTRVTVVALSQRFTEGAEKKLSRTRAAMDLVAREAEAATSVSTAEAALDAGEEGASESLAAALAARVEAAEESEAFLDLLEAYTETQTALTEAQAALDAGTDGADAELVEAQAAADVVAAAMDRLVDAVTQRAKAQKGVDQIERRISAAEDLVGAKEAALTAAREAAAAAVALGEPVSTRGVEYATQLVSEAKEVLAKEQEPLAAARGVVDEAQGVVDTAIDEVPVALGAARAAGWEDDR